MGGSGDNYRVRGVIPQSFVLRSFVFEAGFNNQNWSIRGRERHPSRLEGIFMTWGPEKNSGIGWSRVYISILENTNVSIPVVNSAY